MRLHPCASAWAAFLFACANPPSGGNGFTARSGEAAITTANVLFVGNSLTGTPPAPANVDLPQVLAQLAASRGKTLQYKEAYDFSHTLLESWQANIPEPYLTGATKWDFISVQEYSTLPVQNPDQFYATLTTTYQPSLLASLNPASGRVILFENWAVTDITPFPTRAAYTAALDANYATLLSRLVAPALIAPLSRAWEQVFTQKPQSFLFVDDKHPNGAGVYLNACVYYAIVFGDTPVGLPSLYLSAADATFLQAVAAQVTAAPIPDPGPGTETTDAGTGVDAETGVDAGARSKGKPSDPPIRMNSASVGGAGCSSARGAAGFISLLGIAAYAIRRRFSRRAP